MEQRGQQQAIWGGLGHVFEAPKRPIEALLGNLGGQCPCRALLTALGFSWSPLGVFGSLLGPSWGPRGHVEPSRRSRGAFWAHVGSCLGASSAVWSCL
eukprot:2287832-Pyramimonas_sp.AAC.1